MINKMLICGFGSIGKKYYKLLRLNYKNIKVGLLRHNSRDNYLEKDDVKIFHTSEDSLSWDPDAVIIANPAPFHLRQAIFFAQNNIPLLIEKPLGVDSQIFNSCKDLESLSKNIPILVGYVLRHDPAHNQIKKYLRDELIGRIVDASFSCGSWLPSWRENQDYKNSVSARSELGGGVLLEMSHELDLANSFLGKIDIKHSVISNSNLLDIDSNVEDKALITGVSKDQVFVNINLNFCTKPSFREVLLIGSNGLIQWNLTSGNLIHINEHNIETVKTYPIDPLFRLNLELKHFIKCCLKQEEPIVKFQDGLNVLNQISEIRLFNQ